MKFTNTTKISLKLATNTLSIVFTVSMCFLMYLTEDVFVSFFYVFMVVFV